jgi:segregation and condensation protein A
MRRVSREWTATEQPMDSAGGDAASFEVTLPTFEGPLDLLLHLIREHRLDILDIPIAFVTARYLEYLDLMRELNIDLAAEFLVMAATLAHLKSKMLLPREVVADQGASDLDEAGQDPRTALVIRLLEYQKYRDAGERLSQRALLGRDVFLRPLAAPDDLPEESEVTLREASAFDLVVAFDRALRSARRETPTEIVADRLSLSDAIGGITDRLAREVAVSLRQLLEPLTDLEEADPPLRRQRLVVTFLALLEMARLRLIRIRQEDAGDIVLERRGPTFAGESQALVASAGGRS